MSREMERARAARCWLETTEKNKAQELAAFLSIFHPEMPRKRRKQLEQMLKKGFTLVELMVVVAIVGILLAIVAGTGVLDSLWRFIQDIWRSAT